MKNKFSQLFATIIFLALIPNLGFACACGCGMFDVGTTSNLPTSVGGFAYLQYDYVNQNQNWSGKNKAPESDNEDKKIRSDYLTLGGQYMFNRKWGFMAKVPYVNRQVKTFDHHEEVIDVTSHNSIGDIKLMTVYSGFADNMSTGLTFGVKLPTGKTDQTAFSSDTQIGSGSTDTLLGAYHFGKITSDNRWNYFTQVMWQHTASHRHQFNPGDELSGAIGTYYDLGNLGTSAKFSPMLQLTGTKKYENKSTDHHHQDSGYEKLFLAPGLEINFDRIRLYGGAQFAVYQNISGNQLTAERTFTVIAGYKF